MYLHMHIDLWYDVCKLDICMYTVYIWWYLAHVVEKAVTWIWSNVVPIPTMPKICRVWLIANHSAKYSKLFCFRALPMMALLFLHSVTYSNFLLQMEYKQPLDRLFTSLSCMDSWCTGNSHFHQGIINETMNTQILLFIHHKKSVNYGIWRWIHL